MKPANFALAIASAIALVALAVGCNGPSGSAPLPDDLRPTPGRNEIVLVVGEEVRVDDLLRIAFTGVPADSRCPRTVVCPWEGDGAVEIAYALGEGPSYPDTLHTSVQPKSVVFGGYEITLRDLMPYPYGTDLIPLDEYAIRLHVGRAEN